MKPGVTTEPTRPGRALRLMNRPTAAVLALLTSVHGTGCATWTTVTAPAAFAPNPGHKVRVVLQNGGTITADSVKAGADSIVTYQSDDVGAVSLAQVRKIQVHQPNAGATVGLAVGIVAAVLSVFMVLASRGT